jgi:hypothetical protein
MSTSTPYMQVPQDYAHHIVAQPLERVGAWYIFAWPTAVPEGWDRVSTPLLTEARLVALRAQCAGGVWPEPNPQPIPEPEPIDEEPA